MGMYVQHIYVGLLVCVLMANRHSLGQTHLEPIHSPTGSLAMCTRCHSTMMPIVAQAHALLHPLISFSPFPPCFVFSRTDWTISQPSFLCVPSFLYLFLRLHLSFCLSTTLQGVERDRCRKLKLVLHYRFTLKI